MADTLITVGTYLTLFLTLPILTAIAIVYWNNKKGADALCFIVNQLKTYDEGSVVKS